MSPDPPVNLPPNYRTVTCKYWLEDRCRHGDNCTFLHEHTDNRDHSTTLAMEISRHDRRVSETAANSSPQTAMGSFTYQPGSNAYGSLPFPPSSMPIMGGFQRPNVGPSFDWVPHHLNRNFGVMGQQNLNMMQAAANFNVPQMMPQMQMQHPQQPRRSSYSYNQPGDGNNFAGGSLTGFRRKKYYPSRPQHEGGFVPNYNRPCHYFLKGYCKMENDCKFLHLTSAQVTSLDMRPAHGKLVYEVIKTDIGETLAEIKASRLKQEDCGTIGMTDYGLVSSYTWAKAANTISVPGTPPCWNEPTLPISISPDKGLVIVDQNGYRHPSHPLEPLFRAVDIALSSNSSSGESSLKDFMSTMDVVTDRNNLRKLLAFTTGGRNKGGEPLKPFRIDFCMIDGTLYLQRWSESVAIQKKGTQYSGFGKSFKNKVTKIEDGGACHHRIVRFNLGGLKIMMRYEVDGYDAALIGNSEEQPPDFYLEHVTGNRTSVVISPKEEKEEPKKEVGLAAPARRPSITRTHSSRQRAASVSDYIKSQLSKSNDSKDTNKLEFPPSKKNPFDDSSSDSSEMEKVVKAVRGLSMSSPTKPNIELPTTTTAKGLHVLHAHAGKHVPSTAVIELKTRFQALNMDELLPQIYFAQTPLLYVGYHDGHSCINKVDKLETYEHIVSFERNMQEELRKMINLLSMLKTVTVNALSEVEGSGRRVQIPGAPGDAEEGEIVEGKGVRKFAAICIPKRSWGEGAEELTLRVYEVKGKWDLLPEDLMVKMGHGKAGA